MANCILKARQGCAPIGLFTKTACGLHVVPAPRLPRPDLDHGLKSFPWKIAYFQSPFLTQDTMWHRPTVHEGAEKLYYFRHNESQVPTATLCNLCSSPKCYTSPALTALFAQLLARTLAAVEEGITFPPGFLGPCSLRLCTQLGNLIFFFTKHLSLAFKGLCDNMTSLSTPLPSPNGLDQPGGCCTGCEFFTSMTCL